MDHPSDALRVFDDTYFGRLIRAASGAVRNRQHDNLHARHDEPSQRLFNAIGHDSYIRPHRHRADPKSETLIAVRGRLALLLFDDDGVVADRLVFGEATDAAGVELAAGAWHTVLALTPHAVLFESKRSIDRVVAASACW